jgi:hypothetical protein
MVAKDKCNYLRWWEESDALIEVDGKGFQIAPAESECDEEDCTQSSSTNDL